MGKENMGMIHEAKRIVIATKNKGKLTELEAPLLSLGFSVETLPSDYIDIPETGASFEENALIKARYVCQDLGLPALADDSGISVEALDSISNLEKNAWLTSGEPGIFSARYADDFPDLEKSDARYPETRDTKNIRKLLYKLRDVPKRNRACAFHCAMALVFPAKNSKDNFGLEIVVHELWKGQVLDKTVGDNGFGYDPIFFDEELGLSSAQLEKEVKMARSHRGKALKSLFSELEKQIDSL